MNWAQSRRQEIVIQAGLEKLYRENPIAYHLIDQWIREGGEPLACLIIRLCYELSNHLIELKKEV